jgi:hypothetical protein
VQSEHAIQWLLSVERKLVGRKALGVLIDLLGFPP